MRELAANTYNKIALTCINHLIYNTSRIFDINQHLVATIRSDGLSLDFLSMHSSNSFELDVKGVFSTSQEAHSMLSK